MEEQFDEQFEQIGVDFNAHIRALADQLANICGPNGLHH
jgi:hypothetical protein